MLVARILMYMNQMNEVKRGSAVDLVFFRDCVTHLIIINRILRIPRGNGLLVGIGGSGRKSVTTLASFIAGYLQHSIFLTRYVFHQTATLVLSGVFTQWHECGRTNPPLPIFSVNIDMDLFGYSYFGEHLSTK